MRKYAATPPAVYFRTLTWTALKVNANISGTGTFQVGSQTYPITYPQKAQLLINGTLQTTYVQMFGEQRRTWDWIETDVAPGSTTVKLKNGIPLRRGDYIIVYGDVPNRDENGVRFVLDYNPVTREATLPASPLRGIGERFVFPRTTILLMTCTIDFLKFGGNNVYYAAGTNFIFSGVFFTRLPLFMPTASGSGGNLTNPTFLYCANFRMTANDYDGHWVKGGSNGTWQWCCCEAWTFAWGWAGNNWANSDTNISTISDCCLHNPRWGMSFDGKNTWLRCYQQGGSNGTGYAGLRPGSVFDGCVFIDSGGNSFNDIVIKNCSFVNSSGLGGSRNIYENIAFYNDNNNRTYLGGTHNIFKNITLHLNSTHWNILMDGSLEITVTNVTVNSYVSRPFLAISKNTWNSRLANLTVNGDCDVKIEADPSSISNVVPGGQMLASFRNLTFSIVTAPGYFFPGRAV